MRRTWSRVGVAWLLLLGLAVAVPAASATALEEIAPSSPLPSADSYAAVAEGTNLWFVQLASPPAAKGTSQGKLNSERQAFRAAAREAGLEVNERYAFGRLWNGLSVQVADAKDVSALSRLPGVTAVYPVLTVSIPSTSPISPELATAINMTGAAAAQESGYTGEGVKVAVMDTGIDYDHADLGGDGTNRLDSAEFPTPRVVAGHDFVGDAFNADSTSPAYNPNPSPDGRPDDCNGHGTHVSGIVGANPASEDGVKGVAPDVTFGAYRVFGCDGSTTVDIMIAAMERAAIDGMDVLNMSIGSAFNTWADYPTAAAADALVEDGMVVVASIGNSGANGIYSAGAPGVGDHVIGVASYDNTHISAVTFDVNPGGQKVAYLPLSTTPDPPTSGDSDEVVFVGRGCVSSLGDTYEADPAGKTALIIRGDCTFEEKYQGAADAGATAVVIHNQFEGLFAGGGVTPRDEIPGVGISRADGLHIRSQLDAGETVTFTWTDERINAVNPTGGLISSFSSYGLGAELALKPDIGGPGGLIRSTYPLQNGGYAIVSGTSMSSPHVAGTVAQLLQAKGVPSSGDEAKAIRGMLQNTADPKLWSGNPGLGFLEPIHRQGAGMVQIDKAIAAPVVVSPGKISLGEGSGGTHTLTLRNGGSSDVTYGLSHQPALSTAGTFAPGFFLWHQTASFSASSVTVPAGGQATVDVTITGPERQGRLYGGYVVLTPEGGGTTFRVPYAGFGGDYQGFPVMNGLPQWDEVQTVRVTGSPTDGSFTLTFTPPGGGAAETTDPIAFDATAAAVRAALAALPSIGGNANVLTSGNLTAGVNVTFTGALGQQNIPEMTATSSLTGGTDPDVTVTTARQGQPSFPKLAKREGWASPSLFAATYSFPEGPITYTLEKRNVFGRHVTDAPTVAVHLDHQVRTMTVTALDAAGNPIVSDGGKGTVDPTVLESNFVARNSTSGSFFAIEWDGRLTRTLKNGKEQQWALPDGSYMLKVDILKAGGDPATAGHTESYTSPLFTIDRH